VVAVLMDLPEPHAYYTANLDTLQHAARARLQDVGIKVIRTDRLVAVSELPFAEFAE
jgi:hypothetical protein